MLKIKYHIKPSNYYAGYESRDFRTLHSISSKQEMHMKNQSYYIDFNGCELEIEPFYLNIRVLSDKKLSQIQLSFLYPMIRCLESKKIK